MSILSKLKGLFGLSKSTASETVSETVPTTVSAESVNVTAIVTTEETNTTVLSTEDKIKLAISKLKLANVPTTNVNIVAETGLSKSTVSKYVNIIKNKGN